MAFKQAWNGLTYRSSDKTELVLGKRKRELVSQLPHAASSHGTSQRIAQNFFVTANIHDFTELDAKGSNERGLWERLSGSSSLPKSSSGISIAF